VVILLTTLIGFISSWPVGPRIENRLKEYYAFFLILQGQACWVCSSALDFLLFFVLWETVLAADVLHQSGYGRPRAGARLDQVMIYL